MSITVRDLKKLLVDKFDQDKVMYSDRTISKVQNDWAGH